MNEAVRAVVGTNTQGSSVTQLLSVLPQTVGSLNDTLTILSSNFGSLVSTTQSQSEALLANTQAIIQDTSERQSEGIGATLGKAASSLFGGLGFSPILSGLLDLFGGNGPSAPQPVHPFLLPPSLTFQGANATLSPDSAFPGADYNQSGVPRLIQEPLGAASPTPPAAVPQITINVQAMDSRSFSDHSSDIAKAVREAILSMHSLNDVISDL